MSSPHVNLHDRLPNRDHFHLSGKHLIMLLLGSRRHELGQDRHVAWKTDPREGWLPASHEGLLDDSQRDEHIGDVVEASHLGFELAGGDVAVAKLSGGFLEGDGVAVSEEELDEVTGEVGEHLLLVALGFEHAEDLGFRFDGLTGLVLLDGVVDGVNFAPDVAVLFGSKNDFEGL